MPPAKRKKHMRGMRMCTPLFRYFRLRLFLMSVIRREWRSQE